MGLYDGGTLVEKIPPNVKLFNGSVLRLIIKWLFINISEHKNMEILTNRFRHPGCILMHCASAHNYWTCTPSSWGGDTESK